MHCKIDAKNHHFLGNRCQGGSLRQAGEEPHPLSVHADHACSSGDDEGV